MADVPLLTSLPPAIARRDAKGNEIGREYQRRCAESWREAGFLPISVNSAGEVGACPALPAMAQDLGVRVVVVDRDASVITRRPHVFSVRPPQYRKSRVGRRSVCHYQRGYLVRRDVHVANGNGSTDARGVLARPTNRHTRRGTTHRLAASRRVRCVRRAFRGDERPGEYRADPWCTVVGPLLPVNAVDQGLSPRPAPGARVSSGSQRTMGLGCLAEPRNTLHGRGGRRTEISRQPFQSRGARV